MSSFFRVAVLMTSDRPACRDISLESLEAFLPFLPQEIVSVIDDDHELGFAGAVAEGWRRVNALDVDYVLHWEDDFAWADRENLIPVGQMIAALERHPHLTQMSLLRNPVNQEELAAGGIIPQNPDQYEQCGDGIAEWVETDRFLFTTNPSVYSAAMCRRRWPDAPESEGKFGGSLRAENPAYRCGIWGRLEDPPRVQHFGERIGVGY
jgi:hypothetical protein